MATTQINPTRMELTRLKKKLGTAVKGHRLLKDKRDELMREFLDLVKVNMELREKVEKGIKNANNNFVLAKAGMSDEELRSALMAPKQEISLVTDKKNVMSVDIPVYDFKTKSADSNDIYSYGFAFTSGDLDYAVDSLQEVFRDMLKLAEVENGIYRLAVAIKKTQKRANALKNILIPKFIGISKYISDSLEEKEKN